MPQRNHPMSFEEGTTKLGLIQAAGELFANHGLDGTSIRAIADKAGVNIAAVNYHFGSKEHLYSETLMYVAQRGEHYPAVRALEDKRRLSTPAGQAEVVREIVRAKFETIFAAEVPKWYWQLLMRSLLDPTPSLEAVVRKIFQPEHEAIKELMVRVRPGISEEEAHLWAVLLFGAVAIFEFARSPILMLLGQEDYTPEFIARAREFVAHAMLVALGLAPSCDISNAPEGEPR